jgi:hypothetical protein
MAIILVRMQCSHVSLPPCYLTVLRTRWECGERKGLQQIWRLFWGQPGRRKLLTRDDARRIAVEGAPALRGKPGRQPQRLCCMRKAVRFLLPLLACLLSACATPHWVKPEASKSDLAQDQAACVQAVQQPPAPGTTDQQQYEACMNAHGWKLQQ